MPDIELTDEELKNGWTKETLSAYFEECELAEAEIVLYSKSPRPKWANSLYSPMRWRG